MAPKNELKQNRRRITDLMNAGVLKSGDVLIHKRTIQKQVIEVVITSSGSIKFKDGLEFNTPTSAAKYASGASNVNGWRYWKVRRVGCYLADLVS